MAGHNPQQPHSQSPQRPTAQSPEQRHEEILVRNIAISDFNRKAFVQFVLSLLVLVSAVFVTNSLRGQVANPLNVPVDNEMRYIAPLKKVVHNKSDSEVATYAANIMGKMLSFDWYNVVFQTNQNVSYFTNDGWLGFKDNLERSGILQMVLDNHDILSFQLADTPVVLNKGVEKINGEEVAFWTVKMNAQLLFVNSARGGTRRTEKAEIVVRVVRVSTMESESGIAIQRSIIKFK